MEVAGIILMTIFVVGSVYRILTTLDLMSDTLTEIRNELSKANSHLDDIHYRDLTEVSRLLDKIETNTNQ